MKKLKLLPSILMLVLCVGVLAVGVFAITPTKNTITGTITINATNADVTMTAYKDSISGTNLGSITARAGDDLDIGNLEFSMENVNTVENVNPVVIVVVFTTSSTENLVIETKNTESFDGLTTDGTNTVVNNVVSATKTHTAGLTDTETNLPAFNKTNSYQITCSIKLNRLPNQQLQVPLKLKFNIYKASEYTAYTTEVVDGKTYYTFGSFPQSQADTTGLTLIDTYTNHMAYDDATGGVAYNDIYQDQNGNEYVKLSNNYYKVEPLKWRQLTTSDGTAMLLCENIVERVQFYTSSENRTINGQTIYANNYEHSTQRSYLNNTFYNSAFNNLEMSLIPKTVVDNSASTTSSTSNSYACTNTNDYVFALSYQDLLNASYGFSTSTSGSDTRVKQTTAYSVSTGVYDWGGSGFWWMRSPDSNDSKSAGCLDPDGGYGARVNNDGFDNGVVPALRLSLS